MVEAVIDLYRAAFEARASADRLLVTDDREYDRLATAREVTVFEDASRCDEFLRSQSGWTADRPATAMVLRDVSAVADATLPDGLVVRSVNRLGSEGPNAVALHDAAAVAIASDPGITEPVDDFARYLQSLSSSARLFAAVDDAGVAHATSGFQVFGEYARIFFVNTEPGWRQRGIGRAMTVEALRAAALAGATRAFLHATDDGASVYLRLGFESAGRLTRYSRVSALGEPRETVVG